MSAQVRALRASSRRLFSAAWTLLVLLAATVAPSHAQGSYLLPGIVSTVAGSSSPTFNLDGPGNPATAVQVYPAGIALDSAGNLYIADVNKCVIHRVDATTGGISVVAGVENDCGFGLEGPGILASVTPLSHPQGVAVDAAGNIYIADTANGRIRKVDVNTGEMYTVAGGAFGIPVDGTLATAAPLVNPVNVLVNAAGDLFIAQNYLISKVDHTSGKIYAFAGTGAPGNSGDGAAANAALIGTPYGMAVDTAGNFFYADFSFNQVHEVTVDGNIHTIAGTGTPGYTGDGLFATTAQLNLPYGVAVDHSGNVYIADTGNNVIREITTNGIISTVAGTGASGYTGDGGPALWAQFHGPTGLVLDGSGNLYLSDAGNLVVRKIKATQAGTKTPPQLSTGNIDFGTQPAGTTSNYWTVNISNTVDTPLNLYSIFVSDPVNFVMTTDCGTVLPAYSSCRVQVSFSPSAAKGFTGILYVVTDASHSPHKVTLIGTGTSNAPTVVVAPTSIDFGQQGIGSTSNPWTVTLNNTSAFPMTVSGISVSDPINFTILSSTCTSSLSAHSTCTVQVAFTPHDTVTYSGTLDFHDNASTGGGTQSVTLTGTGTQAFSVSPTFIDFGPQAFGTTSNPWTITVNNQTGSPLGLASIALNDNFNFHLVNNCPSTVPAHTTCTLLVTFVPGGPSGSFATTLNIQPSIGLPQTVTLTGTATLSYQHAILSPANVDFGQINVGSMSDPWTIQLSNPNNSQLNLVSLNLTQPGFVIQSSNCGTILPAFSSCQFKLVFLPTTLGTFNGTLVVGVNYTVNNSTVVFGEPLQVNLTGKGFQGVFFSPTTIDFGSLTNGKTSNPWTITLNNSSGSPVVASALHLSDASNFTIVNNACTTFLPAHSTCNIQVAFTPQGAGTLNSTLTATLTSIYDSSITSQISVALTGKGSPTPDYSLSVNPAVLNLTAGQAGTATFTFTPVGGYQGTVYFACAGLPAGVNCLFNPGSVTANGSDQVQTSTLTVTTTAPYSGPVSVSGFALLPGIALAGLLAWRRRKLMPAVRLLMLLVAMACILGGAMGCGSGVPSSLGATPTGSHVLTVSASTTASGGSSSGSSSGSGSSTTTTTHTADFTIIIH